ncbi:Protein GrpE [uncultured archaeon]|nr:Protein GrpE [uncultured archaeon]
MVFIIAAIILFGDEMTDNKPAKDEVPKKEAEKKALSETDVLKLELAEKSKLADDYLSRLKYLQAEFDNFRKREEAERKEFVKFANHELLSSLLQIVDDFQRAIAATKDEKDKTALEMILKRFTKVLEERGVKPIDALGKKFDPHLHEAFLSEETDKAEEGTVLEELQKGYMLHDKVLRHSKVKVAKAKEKK